MIVYTKASTGGGTSQMLRAGKWQPPAGPGLGHASGLGQGEELEQRQVRGKSGSRAWGKVGRKHNGAASWKKGWGDHVLLILKFSNH